MIPVTTSPDQHLALFGLGGSGLATALALMAAAPTCPAWDDNAEAARRARRAGIAVRTCTTRTGRASPRWCSRPACRSRIRRRIGRVGSRRRRHRDHRRHRAVLPRAPARSRRSAPFVAITGTNGKSTTTALIAHILGAGGTDVQMGGNIGTAILVAGPPAAGRVHVIECRRSRSTTPRLDPWVGILINVTLGPSRPPRHHGAVRGGQGPTDRWGRTLVRSRGRRRAEPGDRRPARGGPSCASHVPHGDLLVHGRAQPSGDGIFRDAGRHGAGGRQSRHRVARGGLR